MASLNQQTVWIGAGGDDGLLDAVSTLRNQMDARVPLACVEIVKRDRDEEPDATDVAEFFAAFGAAWALASLEEPLRPEAENKDPALEAAIAAFSAWHGGEWEAD